ncbi:calcium/sodium antiporter [Antarcticibacterium flavum]|uniref:Calcium/sodium antiporter n=1 Tax=Antarcticibacterium flavum TaxID=2058175 RepID=A0A5B7X3S5_9FLAO|nr:MULTISPECIES: calcium/sodium antiporter [Antarcticibacterium]MCM4161116.1 sodium:proton exchanger [Antarcticibacterium sp. W02-3]QCY69382.1 calcium/sodium antiporter [Antarcticibacterium flavum]
MLLNIILLAAGLLLLIKGADWLVFGASSIAKKQQISDLAIGLTIVAFGTSAPELVVNIAASLDGHQEIVFANIIGSNNFNLFFILGVAGLITPLVVQSSTLFKEIPVSFVAVIMVLFLANSFIFQDSILSRFDGVILLILFLLFLGYVYTQLKKEPGKEEIKVINLAVWKIWGLIIIGLVALVAGGKLVVNSAIFMATSMGVSEKLIGLTIIAAGTSLPELATSVVAALKKKSDIAIGNVIGSNIFNIFFILGMSATVRPIIYDMAFNRDIYLLLVGTAVLFIFLFFGKKKLGRIPAGMLVATFILYTLYLISFEI